MIPPIFVQNVYVMYIKISYKFHRIPDTQSRAITKVYDFLGQPSYVGIVTCYLCLFVTELMSEVCSCSISLDFPAQFLFNLALYCAAVGYSQII